MSTCLGGMPQRISISLGDAINVQVYWRLRSPLKQELYWPLIDMSDIGLEELLPPSLGMELDDQAASDRSSAW